MMLLSPMGQAHLGTSRFYIFFVSLFIFVLFKAL